MTTATLRQKFRVLCLACGWQSVRPGLKNPHYFWSVRLEQSCPKCGKAPKWLKAVKEA